MLIGSTVTSEFPSDKEEANLAVRSMARHNIVTKQTGSQYSPKYGKLCVRIDWHFFELHALVIGSTYETYYALRKDVNQNCKTDPRIE